MPDPSKGGPRDRPRLNLFNPDGPARDDVGMREPTSPIFWRVINERIEHLSLRVQSGTFSRDFFENIRQTLLRFGNAWAVVFADGRRFLMPLAEPNRKPALHFGANNEAEAIAKAAQLAADLTGLEPPLAGAHACQNGSREISEGDNDDLTRWLVANPQWESGHTKGNYLAMIVEAFLWFEEERGFRSPYRRKRIPKMVKPSRREATDEEYIALMRHGCRELRRMLWCLYNLDGIRPCELREMLWSDFNWEGEFVLVYQHKTARATNRPRLFALTPRQSRFLRNLFKQRVPASDYVFLNTEDRPWTRRALAQNIRRVAERIGLDEDVAKKVSAYCFRHTWSTQVDEAGLRDQDAAMLLGHTDPKMLRTVYSKASRKVKHVRRVANKAERLRREARKGQIKETEE